MKNQGTLCSSGSLNLGLKSCFVYVSVRICACVHMHRETYTYGVYGRHTHAHIYIRICTQRDTHSRCGVCMCMSMHTRMYIELCIQTNKSDVQNIKLHSKYRTGWPPFSTSTISARDKDKPDKTGSLADCYSINGWPLRQQLSEFFIHLSKEKGKK